MTAFCGVLVVRRVRGNAKVDRTGERVERNQKSRRDAGVTEVQLSHREAAESMSIFAFRKFEARAAQTPEFIRARAGFARNDRVRVATRRSLPVRMKPSQHLPV